MSEPSGDASTDSGEEAKPVESPDAETLDEEPRNLIIALVKEIRIGMDLSRITLPTFILEPRSMLEKLTDFMTHGELLALVQTMQDPVERMVGVVKWYLSGFYIKPQGVKKPYNPLLGEFFRCKWVHGDGSTTYYVSEQVSHHPPISCLYFSNRKEGFVINGSIHPRSKFLGTSVASIMDGEATVTILPFAEEYTITFPSVYGRGILFGTLLMELVGLVNINCKQTGCKAEIDFKAKPFFGGEYNSIQGKIKKKDTLYTLSGKWDSKIDITHCKSKSTEVFWDPQGAKRAPKIIRPFDEQEDFESQKLWINVTQAIKKKDQKEATVEKTKLEEGQRARAMERKENEAEWCPRLFQEEGDEWVYKYINISPYDPSEQEQEESDGIIYSVGRGKEETVRDAEAREPGDFHLGSSSSSDLKSSSSGDLKSSAGMKSSGGIRSSAGLTASGGVGKSKSNGRK